MNLALSSIPPPPQILGSSGPHAAEWPPPDFVAETKVLDPPMDGGVTL